MLQETEQRDENRKRKNVGWEGSGLAWLTTTLAIAATLLLLVPSAVASHLGPNNPCGGHGGDLDGDGECDDQDDDDDNDGALDVDDPHPDQYSEMDWVMATIKGLFT